MALTFDLLYKNLMKLSMVRV